MFSVAIDILPIQASSVPCERVFSSAKETFPMRRSNLSAEVFEALQILKSRIRQQRLSFTDDWLTKESDFSDDTDTVESDVKTVEPFFERRIDAFVLGCVVHVRAKCPDACVHFAV